MTSQVLYRKWRPQTLADVVGQEPVTQTLLNALATGRLAHAYLFCGPRGTGKTSTGRIMAKAVNCLSNGNGEPCNSCSICQDITDGRALDLVEIDGASNRGIDEIRDIREKINFAPNVARYKVYIIDEVHMLTEPAFNALLKTLEEPPPHAIFVLATTEVHKVPLTILSRCQRFDFRRIPQAVVVNKLQQICDQEGITVEPPALALVAKAATGSLRDAENLLEQIILHYGTNISDEQIRSELGMSEDERVHEFAKHVLDGDVPGGLEIINSMAADSMDLRQTSRSLVEYLRKLLLIKAGAIGTADPPAEIAEEMKALVANRPLEDLSKAIKLFAQIDFRTDPQATLPLELALIDFSLSASLKPSQGPKESTSSSISKKTDKAIVSESESSLASPESDQQEDTVELPIEASTFIESVDETASPASPHNVEYIRQHWNDFINACRGMGSSGHLDALLRNSCQVADLEGNTLVLDFRHEWHKSKIEDPKYRHQVEVKLQEVFKYPYQVRCTLTTKNRETSRSQKASNPVVEAAIEMGAKIVGEEHENDE